MYIYKYILNIYIYIYIYNTYIYIYIYIYIPRYLENISDGFDFYVLMRKCLI